ncbi:hypothetical protein PTI98_012470 [Pleurotus ostreatus]|nr:hypothetical protein PTI98_012470 [Pleurotus ostreatus]
MVHRSSNSLLLTNLISQETLYSSSLSSLLNTSHVSITLYEAYAASSSADVAQLVMSVVEAMRAVDDALRGYEGKIKEGREVLKSVEKLEEEVGNVARDRDILVNRLIKASKSTKRASIPHSNSSSSFPSPFSSTATSSKLNAAQAELQACEAHLTAKERELEKRRGDVVEQALMGRCRGIVECGQIWVERGQRALSVLEQASLTAREANDPNRRPLSLHSPFQLYQSPVAGASAQSHGSQPQPRQVHTPPLSTSGTGSAGSSKPLPQVNQHDTHRLSYISSNASFVSLSQYSTSTATSSLAPSQSVSQVNGGDVVDVEPRIGTSPDHQERERENSPRFSSPLPSSPPPLPSHSPALLPLPPPNTDIVDINAPRPSSQHIYSNAEFLDVGGSVNSHATTTTETGETATTRTTTQDHTTDNANGVQRPHFRQPSPVQHLQHHLNIPPAHAISELALPTSMSLPSFTPATNTSTPSLPVTPTSRWLLGGRRDSWRERRESWSHGSGVKRSYLSESEGRRGASEGVIAVGGSVGADTSKGVGASSSQMRVNESEEPPERGEVEEDSSDEEVEDARVVVVENPRFATGRSSKKAKETNGVGIGRRGGSGGMSPSKRERRTSLGMGFFGSIRGLFTHGSPTKDSSPGKAHSHQGDQRPNGVHADDDEKEGGGFFRRGSRRGGKWETRTNDNLKDMMRKGKGRDSDSDAGGGGGGDLGEMFSSPSRSSMQTVTAHNTPGSAPSFASGGVAIGGATVRRPSMNGSTSTLGAPGSPSGARNKLRKGQGKKGKKNNRKTSTDDVDATGVGGVGSKDGGNRGTVGNNDQNRPTGSPKRTLSMKRPATVLQVTPPPTKPLASPPPLHSSPPPRTHPSAGGGSSNQGDLQRKASLSSAMSVPIISALAPSPSNVGSGKGHRRASSVGHGSGAGSRTPSQNYSGARGSIDEGMTLLTIVEDMARLNRMASANRGRGGLGSDLKAAVGGSGVTASSGGQTLVRSKSKSHSNMPSTSSAASSALSGGLVGLMDVKAPPSVGRRELENELAGNTERQNPSSHTKASSYSSRADDLPSKSQSPRQGDTSKRSLANSNTNGNATTPFAIPQAPGSVLHLSASSTPTSRPHAGSSVSALAFPPRSSSPLSTTMPSGSPRGSLDSGLSGGSAVGRSRPAKSPLKSALKHSSSRSPSPMTLGGRVPPSASAIGGSSAASGSGTGAVVAQSQAVNPTVRDLDEGGRLAVGSERKRSLKGKGEGKAKVSNIINDGDQVDSDSDSASYETVHEALTADEDSDGDDNEPTCQPTAGTALSNVEVPHTHPHFETSVQSNTDSFHKGDDTPRISAANGRPAMAMSDISSASASTTTMNSSPSPHSHKPLPPLGTIPGSASTAAAADQEAEEKVQRRKSVRVSLKPSYAAPPVINDDEDEEAEGGNHEDSINNGEVIDMWKDSSDEDLEYERAKKRLSRAGETKKGSKKRSKVQKDISR